MRKRPQNGIQFQFPPGQAISVDPEAFDQAIQTQGVRLLHYRGLKCPVGMVDRYDSRRPHEDHSGCSNGHIYTAAGVVTCLFTGVSEDKKRDDIGFIDGSTVQVTSTRFYDDTREEVQVAAFDRFYLEEEAITVPHHQLVESHITGKDKLSFPVVHVMDLIDAHGKRYEEGEDFLVDEGQIRWLNGGLGFDSTRNKGTIYSCRFVYRPYFYVSRVLHQVRVAQVDGPIERTLIRMPQQFMLVREIIFENQENDPQAVNPNDPRQAKSPPDGLFGPR